MQQLSRPRASMNRKAKDQQEAHRVVHGLGRSMGWVGSNFLDFLWVGLGWIGSSWVGLGRVVLMFIFKVVIILLLYSPD